MQNGFENYPGEVKQVLEMAVTKTINVFEQISKFKLSHVKLVTKNTKHTCFFFFEVAIIEAHLFYSA